MKRFCALLLLLPLAFAAPAYAATTSASGRVSGPTQYLGGMVPRYLTVTGLGDARINLVTIDAPTGWSATACPTAPAGWSRTRTGNGCRFTTTSSNGIGYHAVRVFRIDASAAPATADRTGRWRSFAGVTTGRPTDQPPRELSPGEASMVTTAYSLRVTRAVVWHEDYQPRSGSACPAPARSTHPHSNTKLVLCGTNQSTATATLARGHTTLGGTFVSKGTLFSKAVGHGAASVVIGLVDSVVTPETIGTGYTVVLRYGTLASQSSPVTTLPSYSSTNAVPVAESSSPTTATFTISDHDADGDWPPMAVVTQPKHGTLSDLTNERCAAVPRGEPGRCYADLTYTPDPGYTGTDSFTFTGSDHWSTSAPATVSLMAPATS